MSNKLHQRDTGRNDLRHGRRRAIAHGTSNSAYVIDRSGRVYCWGENSSGQLGANSTDDAFVPRLMVGSHSFVKIGKGQNHAAMLKADGTVWTCGSNTSNCLGDGTGIPKSSPVSVLGNHSFVDISVGLNSTLALKADGTCWGWGVNSSGQLGDETLVDRASPVSVVGNHSFVKIATGGSKSLGLKADGSVWEWGAAGWFLEASRSSPTSVAGGHSFVDIAAYVSLYGLKADGSIWSWGTNISNKLGQGASGGSGALSPRPIVGTKYHTLSQVSAGANHTAGLTPEGSAYAWGLNTSGQYGNNTVITSASPVHGTSGLSFYKIASGQNHSLAIRGDGAIFAWGSSASGQLGSNNNGQHNTAMAVYGCLDLNHSFVKAVCAGQNNAFQGQFMLALKADGSVWATGDNTASGGNGPQGILAANDIVDRSSPISAVGGHSFVDLSVSETAANGRKSDGSVWAWGTGSNLGYYAGGGFGIASPLGVFGCFSAYNITQVFAGLQHVVTLNSDGRAVSWGYNGFGQLGDLSVTSRRIPTYAEGNHSFVSVAAGTYHSMGLKADGTVWAWGRNTEGQLGTNFVSSKSSPMSVVGNHSFVKIAAGGHHSAALKSDGTAWGWGQNNSGQVGDNSITNRLSPVSVIGNHSFVEIVCGTSHTLALKSDGTVWSWGLNSTAQLGDNSVTSRSSPVLLAGGHSFVAIASGETHSFGLKSDGTGWAWGDNGNTKLGSGIAGNASTPRSIIGGHLFTSLAGGLSSSGGIKTDGSVWTWGFNSNGELGDNSTTTRSSPVSVLQLPASGTLLAIGSNFTVAKTGQGTFSWGADDFGQLGHFQAASRSVPFAVYGTHFIHSFAKVSCGRHYSIGLKSDGTAWGWGLNTDGQLGDNTRTDRTSSPVSVVGNHSFVDVVAGSLTAAGLKADGTVWTWGVNISGALGDNTTVAGGVKSSPVSVAGDHSFVQISAGCSSEHFLGRKADGSAWAWGMNQNRNLGDGSSTSRSSPVSVIGANSFVQVAAGWQTSYGLKSDGTIWSWGYNASGQAGQNNLTSFILAPTEIVGNHSFVYLSTNSGSVVAIKADGSIWSWGIGNGNFGDNNVVNRSSPVVMMGTYKVHSFVDVAGGGSHSLALKADGTCWAWGLNSSGQLGDGSFTTVSSPVSVSGSHSFVSISAGANHSLARKVDGTVWSWGSSSSAQALSILPDDVTGHSFVKAVAAQNGDYNLALKEDGSAWAWGLNSSGQLGNGTTTLSSTPTSVIGNHSFVNVAAGTSHALGLKQDGSVWAWGLNSSWQLGDGTLFSRSSPVSVLGTGNMGVSNITAGATHSVFLCSNGETFACGSNFNRELGTGVADYGTSGSASSPVLVAGARAICSYASIQAGESYSLALDTTGRVWGWGTQSNAQIGDGTTTAYDSPVMVVGRHSFVDISAGLVSSVGMKDDGSVWAWGSAGNASIGNATSTTTSPREFLPGVPVSHAAVLSSGTLVLDSTGRILGMGANTSNSLGDGGTATSRDSFNTIWGTQRYVPVFATTTCGENSSFGVTESGDVYGWGLNNLTQLAQSGSNTRVSPVYIVGGMTQVSCNSNHTFFRRSDGRLFGVGFINTSGQIGDNSVANRTTIVSLADHRSFALVSASTDGGIALDGNGNAWTWGAGTSGQLGDGTTTSKSAPTSVAGGHSFVSVHGGESMMLALKSDGSAWTWGIAGAKLGINAAGNRSVPTSVAGSHSFVQVSVLLDHCLALKADGSAWAWGTGTSGQLGDNAVTTRSSPVSVVGNHSFIKIAAGQSCSMGLKADGTVWTWGNNSSGRLGDNSVTARSSPVSVVGNHSFVDASYGAHAVARKADGTVWCWGTNANGSLGDGTTTARSSPVLVVGQRVVQSSWIAVAAGNAHALALKPDGTCWSWGAANLGQLGTNSTTQQSSAVSVVGDHVFVKIAGGSNFSAGLKTDGTLWTWGSNTNGNLGHNTTTARSSPTSVVGAHSFVDVYCGDDFMMARKADGTAWGWGLNTSGQLGDSTLTSKSSPVLVSGGHSFTKIATGSAHTVGVKGDGSIWTWGAGSLGRLGTNRTGNASFPTLVYNTYQLHSFAATIKASHTGSGHVLALKADGSAWAWGSGTFGKLGINSLSDQSSPVSVQGGHSFTKLTSGNEFSCGLKADGSVWMWGFGTSGQLGDNSTTSKSSPVSVVGNFVFTDVSGGVTMAVALNSDGKAWAWGNNNSGRLADGTNVSRSSPVSVVGNHTFSRIHVGEDHVVGLKPDGTVWAWGSGLNGRVGDNTATTRSSPVSVVGNHSFASISAGGAHTVGLKSDGTLWSWGYNGFGQLGDGSISDRSSPVSVLGNHAFVQVVAGRYSSLAMKADGTLWAWGSGATANNAALGDGGGVNRSSPVAVLPGNGRYSFVAIAAGMYHMNAVMADGSVWGWGINSSGELATNDVTSANKTTPFVAYTTRREFAGADAAAGAFNSAVLDSNGTIWAWGDNSFGELGTRDSGNSRSIPVQVPMARVSFTRIVGRNTRYAAIRNDGTLYMWGDTQEVANVSSPQAVGYVFGT